MAISDSLKKGTVELLLLKLLLSSDMYGYEITQALKTKSEGDLSIQEGSLYPTLYRLVERGYVTNEQKLVGKRRTRVYYHITPEGKKRFQDLQQEYLRLSEGIMRILHEQSPAEPAPAQIE